MIDDFLELLLELGLEDMINIVLGLIAVLVGVILIVAGYFLNFSILDELAIAAGLLLVLAGIVFAAYQLLIELIL